jgi:hypothetical protein
MRSWMNDIQIFGTRLPPAVLQFMMGASRVAPFAGLVESVWKEGQIADVKEYRGSLSRGV